MRSLVVLILLVFLSPAYAFEHAIPIIELGSAMQSSDGFRVEVESVILQPNRTEGAGAVPLISFVVHVPLQVAKNRLGLVFLEIEGGAGQTLLEALLDHRKHDQKARYVFSAERRLAKDCVLHFEYGLQRSAAYMGKDYVVRLKYHLPKQP